MADLSRPHVHLTRRERQIMDVLYTEEEATAAEVHKALPNSPSYSAVRALLKKLLDKDHVAFREDGPRYVYRPVLAKKAARQGAVSRLLSTFFGGSTAAAVVSLLGSDGDKLDADDLAAIEREIARLKQGSD